MSKRAGRGHWRRAGGRQEALRPPFGQAGKRAEDESKLDWSQVTYQAGDAQGGKQGLAFQYAASKNNREQAERANPLHCTAGCKKGVERDEAGKLVFTSFCPVHLLLHAKTLQARDAGVAVDRLRGPVFGKYRKIKDVPPGATLVASDVQSQALRARTLVLVVTRAQEAAGLFYNGSVPFIVNGRAYRPPCRGVYFEVAGSGYAVHAWASAGGVTHRMRQQMRLANRRSEQEVIPEVEIKELSSKSHRIAMATLLLRKGVPTAEVVEIGEWEDEAMMRTYVEVLAPFAAERRNVTDVMYDAEFTGAQAARALGEAGTPGSDASTAVASSVEGVAAMVTAVLETLSGAARARIESVLDPSEVEASPRVLAARKAAQLEAARSHQEEALADEAITDEAEVDGLTVRDELEHGVAEAVVLQAEARNADTRRSVAVAAGALVLGKRREREKTVYKQCCTKHEGMPSALKMCRIAGDDALQRLLLETASLKPQACVKRLCAADYPATRKEVMNYRNRQRETARCAQLPEVDVAELLSTLGAAE